MPAYLEKWVYSESSVPTTGIYTGAFQDGNTLPLRDATAGVQYYARPNAPVRFTDLLAGWASSLTTQMPGAILVPYSHSTRRVTINSNPQNVELPAGTWFPMIGWLDQFHTPSTDLEPTYPPAGIATLLGIEVEPFQQSSQWELERYRGGRGMSTQFFNHLTTKVVAHMLPEVGRMIQLFPYLLVGKLRVDQGGTGAYGVSNPGGYFDCSVIEVLNFVEQEGYFTLEMLVAREPL